MADPSSSTNIPVYTGVWTNWSRGRIAGATLTLTHQNGALLTAFLAIFVAFVGTSFWRITSFTLHQFISTERPKDGLYHQTQAILRNSGNGTTGFTRLLRVLWAWRYHKTSQPFHRIGPLVIVTAAITVIFAVASIFSAKISSGMGNEVLISSKLCGNLGYDDSVDYNELQSIYEPYLSKLVYSYANYVQTCYTDNTESKAEGCGLLTKRRLTSTIDRNATCPFTGNICRHKDQNIKLDTGHMNIDSELGFNVPPSLQYTFRFITHCAPLITTGYQKSFNYSNDISYMRYFYGPQFIDNPNFKDINWTREFQIPSVPQLKSTDFTSGMSNYQLG